LDRRAAFQEGTLQADQAAPAKSYKKVAARPESLRKRGRADGPLDFGALVLAHFRLDAAMHRIGGQFELWAIGVAPQLLGCSPSFVARPAFTPTKALATGAAVGANDPCHPPVTL